MEQMQKIQSSGGRLMESILQTRLKEIQIYFSNNKELIHADFKKCIDMLYSEACSLQQTEKKGPIQFLSISYLQRCIFTKKHEVRLDLYDKDFYLDKCKTTQYWDMNFLFHFFEQDMEYFKKHIGKLIFQIKDYEEKEFALWYITHYYKIAELFFRDHINDMIHNEFSVSLKRCEDFKVVFGGYMDEQTVLRQLREE